MDIPKLSFELRSCVWRVLCIWASLWTFHSCVSSVAILLWVNNYTFVALGPCVQSVSKSDSMSWNQTVCSWIFVMDRCAKGVELMVKFSNVDMSFWKFHDMMIELPPLHMIWHTITTAIVTKHWRQVSRNIQWRQIGKQQQYICKVGIKKATIALTQ